MIAPISRGLLEGLVWVLTVVVLLVAPGALFAAPYAAMVMDARSGEVIHARNHDTRLHPASLTKMMTLYIAFEAVRNGEITLDTPVRISANAASEPCSCLGLRAGQSIALRYLVRAAAVRSGNDAATAIGEAISGSESAFAERMTRTARAIGMNNTTFRNAHGLTAPGHLSTARDMTLLARQLYFDYPQYYNLFSRISTDAGVGQVLNTNRSFLNAYRGADGIKTGYTRAAGFNLVGSAERNGVRIIATVFGGNSVAHRNGQMAQLLDMGFARAPAQVALNRPAAPSYSAADTSGTRVAGRTIRLETAVRSSLRPLSRPAPDGEPPEEVLVALQSEIESAIAEAQDEIASRSDTSGLEIAPLTLALTPEPRPEHLAEIAGVTDEPGATTPAPVDTGTALALAQTDLDATEATEQGDVAPSEPMLAEAATQAPLPAIPEVPEAPAVSAVILTASPLPQARPEDLRIAAVTPETPVSDAGEIITRMSSSSAQLWGVNIGRYNTRHEAERVLMQTALAEVTTLDGALRRVSQRSGGFDANFMGMTREQADLACRRLQARDRMCFTIGP